MKLQKESTQYEWTLAFYFSLFTFAILNHSSDTCDMHSYRDFPMRCAFRAGLNQITIALMVFFAVKGIETLDIVVADRVRNVDMILLNSLQT